MLVELDKIWRRKKVMLADIYIGSKQHSVESLEASYSSTTSENLWLESTSDRKEAFSDILK